MDLVAASRILPVILRITQFRPTMVDATDLGNGGKSRIGAKILPYNTYTVELQIAKAQVKEYYRTYEKCAKNLDAGVADETGKGRLEMLHHVAQAMRF